MIGRLASAVAIAAIVATPSARAQEFPRFSNHVVDAADVVPPETERQVNAELADHQRRLKNQIAVAIVETTGNQSIQDYANDLFEEWGLGDADEDNGVLVAIAMEDRQLWIEVGFGLEDELTDLESGRIYRDVLRPRLQAGDISSALVESTREIRRKLGDDQVEAPPPDLYQDDGDDSGGGSGRGLWWIIPFFIFGPLSALGGRRRGRRRGWMVPVFWGGGWGGGSLGGGGGSGGFGGGFGGGGGGGSGGGGAGGGW